MNPQPPLDPTDRPQERCARCNDLLDLEPGKVVHCNMCHVSTSYKDPDPVAVSWFDNIKDDPGLSFVFKVTLGAVPITVVETLETVIALHRQMVGAEMSDEDVFWDFCSKARVSMVRREEPNEVRVSPN